MPPSVSGSRTTVSPHDMFTWNAPSWPGTGSSVAPAIERGGWLPTTPNFHEVISSSGTSGTLTFTTTGSVGMSASRPCTITRPTSAADSQCWPAIASSQACPSTPNPATDWLIATPETRPFRAVNAAPTVPEWYTARPTLAPGLMPDTTRSNGSPNAPSRENITHNAGGPVTAHTALAVHPSIRATRTSGRIRWRAPSDAPAPEYSVSGAATTTS